MIKLNVTKREEKGKKLAPKRAEGLVPAVVYGAKQENLNIWINKKDFIKVFHEAGESTIISINGLGEDIEVLIHQLDLDPVSDDVRHIDFYAIERGKKIEVAVALEFIGESDAVKTHGAVLSTNRHDIEISALPKDLPSSLEVDLSALAEIGDQIVVGDVVLPAGVELVTDVNESIAGVSEAKEEEVEVDLDVSSVEAETGGDGEEAPEGEEGGEEKSDE